MSKNLDFYKNKKILVTGHTGFKGSWLCRVLLNAGAEVIGYALDPLSEPNLFSMADIKNNIHHVTGDIRDLKKLDETLRVSFGPDRVDVVSTKIDETWDKFCEITIQISDVLLKLGKNFNRLALCASVKFRLNDGLGESAYSNLIGKSEEKPVEWQIRKVNRYSLQVSEDTKAVVNDVQTISRNNIIVNDEDLKDVIILDLDLNTLVGTESEVIQSIRKPFWHAASTQIQKDISQYQTEFEQWQ